jgi:hypothetical protein
VHIVAVVNGPGELTGWMMPVVERLKVAAPETRITAVVVPCPHASGREREIARASRLIDEVLTVPTFVRRAWGNRHKRTRATDTLVMHFGGDPIYSRVVAALIGAPLWRYGTSASGKKWTERFLVPDDRIRRKLVRQGVAEDRISVVGQVVVDSALSANRRNAGHRVEEASERVLLMPGSRVFELECMVPFFARVVDATLSRSPNTAFAMSRSSFVTRAQFTALARADRCDVVETGSELWLVTPRGFRCRILESEWQSAVGPDGLAVTLPGTNTLQLAALGVPMIVLLPLNWGERIPFDGILGLLLPARLPFGLVKRYLTRVMNRWVHYVALPNIMASDRVVPEMRGVLDPRVVADAVLDLVADPDRRASMSSRLLEIAGPPGAAERAATAMLVRLAGTA